MKRRDFLKTIGLSSVCLTQLLTCIQKNVGSYSKPTDKRFAHLEIKGSYREIGYQIGRVFRNNIKEIISRRREWHSGLMSILKSGEGRKYSDKLLELSQKYFPNVIEEIKGIANGAGIHFDYFWAMNIKSELETAKKEPPGCSSIFVKNDKNMWLFHNEDGHTAYKDNMFTIKAIPPSGVSYISLVYPGIISGNGPSLNSRGIVQTTNYISSTQREIGMPRYIIDRAILEAKDLKEAIQIATFEPRAYPYHHNLAGFNEKRYTSVETIPGISEIKHPDGIYFHTNHLLFDKTKHYQFEDQQYKNNSSLSRYIVINEKLNQLETHNLRPDSLLAILSSHERSPYSPCRHPHEDVLGQTLGTAFIDIYEGRFYLYKGNPCNAVKNNQYITMGF
jgi:isopenicillin-N N-acyltransferase-like protein